MVHTFIGRILCQIGCLQDADVLLVLAEQRRLRVRFGQCAREIGLLSADQLSLALGVQSCGDQIIASLEDVPIDTAVLTRITESVARRCEVMPLFTHNDTLILAVADPFDNPYLQSLSSEASAAVGFIIVHREQLLEAIDAHYGRPVPAHL